jgi:4-amino-4-deoxy-L-arabinose transferase-like glycosyltransferase
MNAHSWAKSHKAYIAIFVLALAARLILFYFDLRAHDNQVGMLVGQTPVTQQALIEHDANIGGDCYYETSKNVLEGHGFSCHLLAPYVPYNYGVPGFPLFLDLLLILGHGSYLFLVLTLILIGALTPLLAMSAVRPLFPSYKWIPIFVGIFLALEPSHVLISLGFSPETLFMPVFIFFVITFFRYLESRSTRYAYGAGLFLGIATLIKPTVQYLPLVAVLFVLWQRRHIIDKKLANQLAIFMLVFVAMIAPWVGMNWYRYGAISLSTQSDRSLYVALLPSVIALDRGISFNEAQAPLLQKHPNEFTYANSVGMNAYTLSQLAQYPKGDLKMAALSAFTFFTHDDVLTVLQNVGVVPNSYLKAPAVMLLMHSPLAFAKTIGSYIQSSFIFVLIARLILIVVFLLFIIGIYELWKKKKLSPVLVFAIILVAYFMLTTMANGLSVTARFRMPIEFIILAITAFGYMSLKEAWPALKALCTKKGM